MFKNSVKKKKAKISFEKKNLSNILTKKKRVSFHHSLSKRKKKSVNKNTSKKLFSRKIRSLRNLKKSYPKLFSENVKNRRSLSKKIKLNKFIKKSKSKNKEIKMNFLKKRNNLNTDYLLMKKNIMKFLNKSKKRKNLSILKNKKKTKINRKENIINFYNPIFESYIKKYNLKKTKIEKKNKKTFKKKKKKKVSKIIYLEKSELLNKLENQFITNKKDKLIDDNFSDITNNESSKSILKIKSFLDKFFKHNK